MTFEPNGWHGVEDELALSLGRTDRYVAYFWNVDAVMRCSGVIREHSPSRYTFRSMVRLRRARAPIPFMRFYEVELAPPDVDRTWRTERAIPAFSAKRRLFQEAFHQRDVADLLLEADELWKAGQRGEWIEHSGVRPASE